MAKSSLLKSSQVTGTGILPIQLRPQLLAGMFATELVASL